MYMQYVIVKSVKLTYVLFSVLFGTQGQVIGGGKAEGDRRG